MSSTLLYPLVQRVNLEFEERRARIASSLSMDKENMSHLPSPTPHLLPTIRNFVAKKK